MKKQFFIVLISVIAITAVLFLTGCGQRQAFDDAMALYESGDYEAASEAFKALGDYENAADMVKACKLKTAMQLYDSGDFEAARQAFDALGDYENAAEMVKACDLKTAMELFDAGDFEAARQVFASLGDYENAADMVKACDLKTAMELFDAGSYEEARAVFAELGEYENSADMVKACDYNKALALYESGAYAEAYPVFAELGDFESSALYASFCSRKIMLEQYKDVFEALNAKIWYFNGGSNTVLNRIAFAGEEIKFTQVNFDGNGKHEGKVTSLSYAVDDKNVIVTLKDGSELKIPYKLSNGTVEFTDKNYKTIKEIEEELQGYWHCSSTSILGLKGEHYIYIHNGEFICESACEGYNLPKGQYYYYGPYSGKYTLNFGGFSSSVSEAREWFFNIINGKATVLHYDNVCSPATKLPGRNGYKF